MYRFKRINKTKMYQLVKEFAGIRDLPSIRQCQFGYYSRSDVCYLCSRKRPDSFKVDYSRWGNKVYLLVSQDPDLNLTYPERKDEVIPLNLQWLHEHGFLDKDPVRREGI